MIKIIIERRNGANDAINIWKINKIIKIGITILFLNLIVSGENNIIAIAIVINNEALMWFWYQDISFTLAIKPVI